MDINEDGREEAIIFDLTWREKKKKVYFSFTLHFSFCHLLLVSHELICLIMAASCVMLHERLIRYDEGVKRSRATSCSLGWEWLSCSSWVSPSFLLLPLLLLLLQLKSLISAWLKEGKGKKHLGFFLTSPFGFLLPFFRMVLLLFFTFLMFSNLSEGLWDRMKSLGKENKKGCERRGLNVESKKWMWETEGKPVKGNPIPGFQAVMHLFCWVPFLSGLFTQLWPYTAWICP